MIARTTGKYNDGEGAASQDGAVQARLLAGSQLLDEHELRDGRNHVEDDLIDQIDRKRALARRRS